MITARHDPVEPGFHVAAMVLSKARGQKQIRQIVAARGRLDPGQTCFRIGPEVFIFGESLVGGMASPENAFMAAMNGRSSMTVKKLGTQRAGSLTNSLTSVCWPWRIEGDDCGYGNNWVNPPSCRTPIDCLNQGHTVCRKCYGPLPDSSQPPDGYPAGLVAAQSIGERGTQLSMKVAHSGGGSEIDIDLIRGVLNNLPDYINHSNSDYVRDRMTELGKYDGVEDRHFHILGKAVGHFTRKEETGLAITDSAIISGNLFNALADGRLWSRLPSFIKSESVSPTKVLTPADLDSILDNNIPALPEALNGIALDEFLRRPDLQKKDLLHIKQAETVTDPTSSPVARILVGNAGAEPEPEIGTLGTDGADDDDGETTEPQDYWGDGASVRREPEDVTGGDEDGDIVPALGELPIERSRIAIVVTGAGNGTRCRVETADRSRIDSNVFQLACLFADLAERQPDLLCRRDGQPPFATQKELIQELLANLLKDTVESEAKENEVAQWEKPMTELAQRGIIYWDSAYLPVRMLCGKKLRRWSCKRVNPST